MLEERPGVDDTEPQGPLAIRVWEGIKALYREFTGFRSLGFKGFRVYGFKRGFVLACVRIKYFTSQGYRLRIKMIKSFNVLEKE